MGDKKGSHVDFAIAFVIFITFIIFLFAIIRPALSHKGDNLEGFANSLSNEIIEDASVEITIISITPENENDLDDKCFDLSGIQELKDHFIGKDEDGNPLNTIGRKIQASNFVKIYSFNESVFEASKSFNCGEDISYEIDLIKTEKLVIKSKLNELVDLEENPIRNKFNIPENAGFAFNLINETQEEVFNSNKIIPDESVYSFTYIIDYLDENAQIRAGLLKITLW